MEHSSNSMVDYQHAMFDCQRVSFCLFHGSYQSEYILLRPNLVTKCGFMFFPTCHVIFYQSACPPLPPPPPRQALRQLPCSVCTAGPQPGSFPAQCAPLDLNLGPAQLSVHRWTSTWDLPSSVCTAGPQRPDRMPEDMPDRMPDRMPEDMPEDMPDRMPEDMPDRICQIECQKICQIECQIECQNVCQIECQKNAR